ncbi:Brp/Blh family beta-carotene 15,15'-dioxygenase [Natribaculum luteum]|uniref:Probable beta-carotene 15,15'-dioxygenase n=1 Tax=Natribaculum luteum TaxID=1586232 RepID=A0ABD5NU01_9EURY|nr:Brp/Blh family beta-carotene 15,15'-dioxygenase [Natribaculum luteum]
MTTYTSSPTPVSSEARSNARRLALLPGWVALAATLVVVLAVETIPLSYQLVPLALSVLVLGLPHGAVDHLVVPQSTDRPFSIETAATVGGVYLLAGGTYAVAWFLEPALAFAFFILLTWFHWGQGELHPRFRLVGATRRSRRAVVETLVVRGGIPMIVPLLAFPDQYRLVAGWLVSLFDPGAVATLEGLFSAEFRTVLGVGFGTLVVLSLVSGVGREDRETWLVDAGETLLLVAFFATVPPLLAIGVYFCAWHSLRHIVRYLLLEERSVVALEEGRSVAVLGRFARDAAPLTALSLVLAVVLYALVPNASGATEDLLALYLVFVAVLTLPHVLFVTWLDLREGLLGNG